MNGQGIALQARGRLNWYLAGSSIAAALGGLLFGFDTAVIAGATHALTALFHLSPASLGVTVASALWGTIFGAMFGGVPADRYGRRRSLLVMAGFYLISATGCGLAWSWWSLVFFRFVGGLAIGGSSVIGPMYIAEISSTNIRCDCLLRHDPPASSWVLCCSIARIPI